MSRSASAARVAVAVVCAASAWLTSVPPADAASQRTFLRSDGADTGTCSLALPCRSFNYAIGQTNAGGEVIILDTAGYGTIVINKSIKVIGPAGVYGGISVQGGPNPTIGVLIDAADTDDITLRGLDVNGVPGAAPLPNIGIGILNAGAVHIEKTSVSNFTQDLSSCINVSASATTVRLYVDDSFLRECRIGIFAWGQAVIGNRSSVVVDNTRIERGLASNPATSPIGVWISGLMALTLRDSVISRAGTAIQFDSNLPGADNTLSIINSTVTNTNNGLVFSGTAGPTRSEIRVVGSQFTNMNTDAFGIVNSASGNVVTLMVSGTRIEDVGNAVTLANSAAGPASRLAVHMDTSQVASAFTAIDLAANNGSSSAATVRDSTFAELTTGIKTRGNSPVSASLIRSEVSACNTVLDHGSGVVRLNSNHISNCANGFVNNGSGNVESNNQNMVRGVANASGFTYITPTPVGLQ